MSAQLSVKTNGEEVLSPRTKSIVQEVVKGSITTGLGFGLGCLSGKILKESVVLTGIIFAVSALATYIFELAAKLLAKKFGWNLSTVNFAKAITGFAMAVATAVTVFALGIIGPVGLGVGISMGLLFAGIPLGFGLSAKFGGKDLPYSEAEEQKGTYYSVSLAFGT